MPPKRRKSPRCEYREGRDRCRSNGTGEPCLCAPHRIVLVEAARATQTPFAGLYGLFEDFIQGRRIPKSKVEAAIGDIVNGFVPQQGWQAPPGWLPQGQQQQQQRAARVPRQPPPPPDPQLEARRRARVALGFAESQPLDAVTIKARHRKLALKHHPDRGGSPSKMAAINSAVDVLLAGI